MGSSEDKIRAWLCLLEAHSRLTDGLARELETEVSLALPRYDVLFKLGEHGGSLRMYELADKILLSRSGLSRLISRMESDGLVRREEHAVDGRGASAVITPRGTRLLRKAIPIAHEYIVTNFASQLSQAEARTLYDILEKLLIAVRESSSSASRNTRGPRNGRAGSVATSGAPGRGRKRSR